jgi:hypothetical protein
MPAGSDIDPYFSDAQLDELLAQNGDNVYTAAAEAWRMKAADFADLVDIDESGSSRKLSQMYKQAMAMAEFFDKQAVVVGGQLVDRTVGRAAKIGRFQPSPAGTPLPLPETFSALNINNDR